MGDDPEQSQSARLQDLPEFLPRQPVRPPSPKRGSTRWGKAQTASLTPPQAEPGPPPPRDVREAQKILTRLGYAPGPADGVIGTRTRDAIATLPAPCRVDRRPHGVEYPAGSLREAQSRGPELTPGSVFRDCIGGSASWVASAGPNLPLGSTLCGPEMVVVPGGRFRMGDLSGAGRDNETPRFTTCASAGLSPPDVTK